MSTFASTPEKEISTDSLRSAVAEVQSMEKPWKARLVNFAAWMVAVTTFFLIWIGGLVTTQVAGMAVPDWPETYGYNMFAYPISAWIYGPFDQLVEHGHRLLGTLAGILSIVLVVMSFYFESRSWIRWMCMTLLLAIIIQGAMGGIRVVRDLRSVAMIHGCTGPLVFAVATSIVVCTSRWWRVDAPLKIANLQSLGTIAPVSTKLLVLVAVVQLFIGAQLRHVESSVDPRIFLSLVHLHLTMAGVVLIVTIWSLVATRSKNLTTRSFIRAPRMIIFLLLMLQISLGAGTWIAKYALPWSDVHPILAHYTIAMKGYWESWIITAHQATGSLLIVTALWLALRVARIGYLARHHLNGITVESREA